MENLKRVFASTAITVLIVAGAVSCTTNPLSIKCSEYVASTDSEQLELAALWAAPSRDHVTDVERIVAPKYRKDLLSYCPKHPDDRLSQLEVSLEFH